MKCANPRIENGVIHFDCPHCTGGLHADESQVQQVWAAMQGQIACPVDICQQPITLPTIEEVGLLKAGGTLEASANAPVTAPQSGEPQKAPESAEDKMPTEVAGESAAPKPAPKADPDAGLATVPDVNPEQEAAVPVATAPATSSDNKLDIVHGFSGAVDAPMTLEQEASSGRTMAIKTIRHSDCVDGDKDTFDEQVTSFLREQGDESIDSVNPIQFSDDEKKPIDYGVLIIFREDLPE
jgi:hypothetical protein